MKYRVVNKDRVDVYPHSEYVKNYLASFDIDNVEDFIKPTKSYLQDPKDLSNINLAAYLFRDTVKSGAKKHFLLVVDSDNDGFTSAAIIYQYIKDMNDEVQIDWLLHEGKQHGLEDHMNYILKNQNLYDLIIVPDASTNDFIYHEALYVPCLILDHHLAETDYFSYNAYIVNNQISEDYKNKALTGAGVTYQFCRYVDQLENTDYASKYIDLAAWGIIGDMGSMMEMENRYLIYTGLKNIRNPLLKALIVKQSYSIQGEMCNSFDEIKIDELTPKHIAFYIVPLVNAVIRVGTKEEKERLFTAFINGTKIVPSGKRGEKGIPVELATDCARECSNARTRQNTQKDKIVANLERKINRENLLDNKVLFIELTDKDVFPSELNGLIAMELADKYQRPTIVARNDNSEIKGSARGLNKTSLNSFKNFLDGSESFTFTAGHDNAFGCGIEEQNVENFLEYANEELENFDFTEHIYDVGFDTVSVDDELKELIFDLDQYNKIWGQDIDEPLIHVGSLYFTISDMEILGKNRDTLKFTKNGMSFIKFRARDLIQKLQLDFGSTLMNIDIKAELVGRGSVNTWGGRTTPQIIIEDFDYVQAPILDF